MKQDRSNWVKVPSVIVHLSYDKTRYVLPEEKPTVWWELVDLSMGNWSDHDIDLLSENWMMAPEAARKVQLLAGPHTETIIKMIRIQQKARKKSGL